MRSFHFHKLGRNGDRLLRDPLEPHRNNLARTGTWSSRVGLKGLIRKFVILLVAIGFHGIDQILQEPWIGAWAIGALSLNELISILENVEKAGFGSIIPQRIQDMLELVKEEHQNKIKSKLPAGVKNE